MFKRGAEQLQGGDPDMLEQIRKWFNEENNKLIESFESRILKMEARQDQLEHRIEELERRLGQQPGNSGGSPTSFVPEYIEIKGFCTWDRRLEQGATREDATTLMALLIPMLPKELQTS